MVELEKDIAAYLKDYDYILEHLKKRGPIGQHEEALYLLTRCLDAISWRSVEAITDEDGRVLTRSPVYPVGDPMRYRIMDAKFVRISTDVDGWRPITPKGEE